MPTNLEVLFTPADFGELPDRDLGDATCVVFDVLRATTSMVTAFVHGAEAIIPVAEISEALAVRARQPEVLLAGERDGVRILAGQTGGIDFDLGNSPREFTGAKVRGKTIAMTTTNGTRALQACARAGTVFIGSFLNLDALAARLRESSSRDVLLVCAGTYEQSAYEDILGAGALADAIWPLFAAGGHSDAAQVARQIYWEQKDDLVAAMQFSRNGRRLLAMPELREDVPFCLRRDTTRILGMLRNGRIQIAGND
jgi:2-phosphosulfolactate phosphatase